MGDEKRISGTFLIGEPVASPTIVMNQLGHIRLDNNPEWITLSEKVAKLEENVKALIHNSKETEKIFKAMGPFLESFRRFLEINS